MRAPNPNGNGIGDPADGDGDVAVGIAAISQLPMRIVSPALDGAVEQQRAGMVSPRADGGGI